MDGNQSTHWTAVKKPHNQQSRSLQTKIGKLEKDVINNLFGLLRLSYPHFLARKSDDEIASIKRLWYAHLESYRKVDIEEAGKEVVNYHPSKPPTIGEFKQVLSNILEQTKHTNPTHGPKIWELCRSYEFTQHHKDVCVTGVKNLASVTPEEVEKVKRMYGKLR